MQVFPLDTEIATLFSQLGVFNSLTHNTETEKWEQIDYYNKNIMDPFFEQTLGFKLLDIQESIPYVAKFFALPFDTTQPEQGDILSKSTIVNGNPEEVCIQEYFGLQTYNKSLPDFLDFLGSN